LICFGLLTRSQKRVLETGSNADHDNGSTQLTEALHGEDGAHHGTSPFGGCEFGSDNGRKGVITTDS
jgi:hypothetical protein